MPNLSSSSKAKQNKTVPTPKQPQSNKRAQREKSKLEAQNKYMTYIQANDPAEIMKDSIATATETCSGKVVSLVSSIAKNAIGFHGGLRHSLSSKSSVAGNDLRDFLKEQTRNWVNSMVSTEAEEYRKEKEEELNQNTSLSSDDRAQQMQEFDEEQRIKSIYLKSSMYDAVKKDVVKRMDIESTKYAKEIDNQFSGDYKAKILQACQKVFEKEFTKANLSSKGAAGGISEDVAKEAAVAKLSTAASAIGSSVFDGIEENIAKKARDFVIKDRDKLIKSLGGNISKNGIRAEFGDKTAQATEKAEDYVYGNASGQFLATGLQSKEEKREEIKKAIRQDLFVTTDMNKGLYYFSKGLFSLVHDDGDTLAISGGLKIPVHEGVFITLNASGELEKDDGNVTGKLTMTVGASGDVGIASISGEVGGFMEISASTPDDFANLISYMLYRQFRESKVVPHQLTNYIWGMGGRSGESSYDEAEAYGALSERKLFGKDIEAENVAKIGALAKIGAELGFEDAGVGASFEVAGGIAREYSKTSFEERGQEDRIGKMEAYKFGGQKSKGQITGNLTVSLGAEAALGGGGAELEVNFRSGKVSDLSITMNGNLTLPGGAEGAQMIASYVLSAVKLVGTNVQRWIETIMKRKKEGKLEKNEMMSVLAADIGGGALETFQLGFAGKPLTDMISDIGKEGFENTSSSSLTLEIGYEWERGTYGDFSITLGSATSIGAELGIANFSVEKGKRIAGWSTKDAKETSGSIAKKIAGGFSI